MMFRRFKKGNAIIDSGIKGSIHIPDLDSVVKRSTE
jgi:hypothetical protein